MEELFSIPLPSTNALRTEEAPYFNLPRALNSLNVYLTVLLLIA